MAGPNGFSLEISADINGFNSKLAEAKKQLDKLKKEAASVQVGGSSANGSGNASNTTAQRKVTAGLMTMSAAIDGATRSLMRFSAVAGSAGIKASAGSMQAATAAAGAKASAGNAAKTMSLAGFLPTAAILGTLGAAPLFKGLQEYGQREKLRVDLGTLLQSDERGADMAGRIQRYAAFTPYSQNNLAGTAKTLLQYGVNENDTEKYMKQLGDVAMGNGQAMNSLGLVLGQVKAAGALKGQDLMQFINAGWNPLETLSQMTGKSMGELKDMASEGAITFEHVAAALATATGEGGRFYQGAERGAKTLQGLTSTIADNIGTALNDIVASQEDNLKALADSWAKFDWSKVVRAGSDLFELTIKGFSQLSEIMQSVAEHEEVIKQIFSVMVSSAAAMAEMKVAESFQNFNQGLRDAAANIGEGTSKLEAFSKSAAGTQVALVGINWGMQQIIRFFMTLPDVFKSNKEAQEMQKKIKERSNVMSSLGGSYQRYKEGTISEETYKGVYQRAEGLAGPLTGTMYDIWSKPEAEAKKEAKGAQTNYYHIDNSKREVKQTNNIKVDESRFMKVVKDNLETLLTSHFRIDNDLTGMQANAG